ncbi:hypothetical protein O181_023523 [Austropuccinia psidii MF-1]|uniref:Uncharacterized protein n=1 Tax=Austropuccinia psidii MF-1 TaxID=1389203 RepID=A0A9Q3CIY7_9BASI|nr:hypothetical protein [Austropuccinia psidii MF-1]
MPDKPDKSAGQAVQCDIAIQHDVRFGQYTVGSFSNCTSSHPQPNTQYRCSISSCGALNNMPQGCKIYKRHLSDVQVIDAVLQSYKQSPLDKSILYPTVVYTVSGGRLATTFSVMYECPVANTGVISCAKCY